MDRASRRDVHQAMLIHEHREHAVSAQAPGEQRTSARRPAIGRQQQVRRRRVAPEIPDAIDPRQIAGVADEQEDVCPGDPSQPPQPFVTFFGQPICEASGGVACGHHRDGA